MNLSRRVRFQCVLLVAFALGGCRSATPPPSTTNSAPRPDFDPRPAHGLSLEAARDAHRRAELRRHLRFMEAIQPGYLLETVAELIPQEKIDARQVGLADLYEFGRLLFEHEYRFADGLGNGLQKERLSTGPFRRVHDGLFGGPETTTCTSCHWRGGPAGAGGIQDNSFFQGDGDHVDSSDARNPPSLQGVGVVQALAREMSIDLHEVRLRLLREAREQGRDVEAELTSKGVRFGVLCVTADGVVDTSRVEGVDADLVIKPFGWKGTFDDLREFVSESLQIHFGIQSDSLTVRNAELHGPKYGSSSDFSDSDGDGIKSELPEGLLTALVAYLAMQEIPVIRPPRTLHDAEPAAKNLIPPTATDYTDEWSTGRALFEEIGCTACHRPMLVLEDPVFRTHSATGAALEIDLSRQGERPRLQYDPRLKGYSVWLFSDMKRHDMGDRSEATHVDHGVGKRHYLTRRLWGLANSPPYFHDGHAAWLDDAIGAHEGEAAEAAQAYRSLDHHEKGALRMYLLSLTRERRVVVP